MNRHELTKRQRLKQIKLDAQIGDSGRLGIEPELRGVYGSGVSAGAGAAVVGVGKAFFIASATILSMARI